MYPRTISTEKPFSILELHVKKKQGVSLTEDSDLIVPFLWLKS